MSQLRQKKIESYINAEIGKLISSKKLKDPRVDSLVTVVGVRVSKDLSFARVFISYYGDEKILNDTVEGLNHAAGYIQIIIAKNVRMRNTPKLLFVSDNSIKQGLISLINNLSTFISPLSIFSNKSSRQVALELSESSMTITTEDPENITTGKEILDCDYDGEPMTIGYNASYLKEVLQHQQSEEIKIMLNSPLNAGLFLPIDQNDNDNKTTLLMPIRLND